QAETSQDLAICGRQDALNLQESFRLDTCGLNDWPPFVDLGPLQRAERLRRLLLAGRNLLDDFDEPLTDPRTGQSSNNGGIKFGHNFLRRSFGYPKPLPDRNIKSRGSRLVHRRNVRRCCQAGLTRNSIGSNLACTYLWQRVRRLIDHEVKLSSQ